MCELKVAREDAEKKIAQLLQKINAPERTYVTFDTAIGDATPVIEFREDGFHFVINEKGEERDRVVSRDLEEILYLLFEGITFDLACEFELANRQRNEDFRRQLFKYQEDLMTRINNEWGARIKARHHQLVNENPWTDED